jgi:hypothetical protein
LAGLTICYFFYPYEDIFFSPRFLAESIPFLALLTARGLEESAYWLRAIFPRVAPRHVQRSLAALLLALSLCAIYPAWLPLRAFYLDARTKIRLAHMCERLLGEENAAVFFLTSAGHNSNAPAIVQFNAMAPGRVEFMYAFEPETLIDYAKRHPDREVFSLNALQIHRWNRQTERFDLRYSHPEAEELRELEPKDPKESPTPAPLGQSEGRK